MTRVVSTNSALDGTFLNQDTRSMVEQSKVAIATLAVDWVIVLEYEDMPTGKSSNLFQFQCLCLGRIEIPKVRRLPNVRVPQIHSFGVCRWSIDMFASNQYQPPCCGRTGQFAYRLATTACRQLKLSERR